METPSASTLADPTWFVCHLLIDRHDFSYLLHEHCRVTSLQIIQFLCISWMALVKLEIMPSGLSPLFFICFSYPCHLLLLKLGFSTKLHLHCLHLTRVCGFCYHPPLLNSGNASGHHLADSKQDRLLVILRQFCRKLFISPILPSLPFLLILSLVVSFDMDLKLNYAFKSISRLLRARRPTVHFSLILQNAPPCYMCSPLSAHQVASV